VLDGKDPWAEVRVAWNPGGVAVAVEAEGTLAALADDDRPDGLYGVQFWVDTRDTRDVSRATRFCHHFDARLTGGTGRTNLGSGSAHGTSHGPSRTPRSATPA